MNIKHLDHLNMTVTDVDATLAWYARLFDFEQVESGVRDGQRWAIIKAGEAMLCIYEAPNRAAPRSGDAHHISHFGLRVGDRAAWVARLEAAGVPVYYNSPVRWPSSTSWYVIDPSGHEIEVVSWDADAVAFPAAA